MQDLRADVARAADAAAQWAVLAGAIRHVNDGSRRVTMTKTSMILDALRSGQPLHLDAIFRHVRAFGYPDNRIMLGVHVNRMSHGRKPLLRRVGRGVYVLINSDDK